jgi:quinol monooxygenase YgiN
MSGFAVYGKMTAKPGLRDELIELLRATIDKLGDPPGLLSYTINTPIGDQDTLWITEAWTSREAHDTATKTQANKAETARIMTLLAAPPDGVYGETVLSR